MNTHSTIFAKATLEYDPEHELELIEAITRTIFETSVVSDVNAIVLRTGETAEVLITILAGVLQCRHRWHAHQRRMAKRSPRQAGERSPQTKRSTGGRRPGGSWQWGRIVKHTPKPPMETAKPTTAVAKPAPSVPWPLAAFCTSERYDRRQRH